MYYEHKVANLSKFKFYVKGNCTELVENVANK